MSTLSAVKTDDLWLSLFMGFICWSSHIRCEQILMWLWEREAFFKYFCNSLVQIAMLLYKVHLCVWNSVNICLLFLIDFSFFVLFQASRDWASPRWSTLSSSQICIQQSILDPHTESKRPYRYTGFKAFYRKNTDFMANYIFDKLIDTINEKYSRYYHALWQITIGLVVMEHWMD